MLSSGKEEVLLREYHGIRADELKCLGQRQVDSTCTVLRTRAGSTPVTSSQLPLALVIPEGRSVRQGFFVFNDFIYLFETERTRTCDREEGQRARDKQTPH